MSVGTLFTATGKDTDCSFQLTLAVVCPGKGDRPLFVTSNQYIPVKNTWVEVQLCFVCPR
jgi:hypothetical protein